MPSSTSSFKDAPRLEPGLLPPWRALLARCGLGGLLALALILACGAGAALRPPPIYNMDRIMLDQQMSRSRTALAADIVVTGDSSGLTSVDARALGDGLGGRRVEILSCLGNVGPAGYAKLIKDQVETGGGLRTALFLFHPLPLTRSFGSLLEEQAVIRGRWPERPFFEMAADVANDQLFDGWLRPLFPGAWGRFYGTGRNLRRFMLENHGGLIDPANKRPCSDERTRQEIGYELSPEAQDSLAQARAFLAEARVGRILVGVSAVPQCLARERDPSARRELALRLAAALGLESTDVIEPPASLPDSLFVGVTHLTPQGRQAYTQALGLALGEKLRD